MGYLVTGLDGAAAIRGLWGRRSAGAGAAVGAARSWPAAVDLGGAHRGRAANCRTLGRSDDFRGFSAMSRVQNKAVRAARRRSGDERTAHQRGRRDRRRSARPNGTPAPIRISASIPATIPASIQTQAEPAADAPTARGSDQETSYNPFISHDFLAAIGGIQIGRRTHRLAAAAPAGDERRTARWSPPRPATPRAIRAANTSSTAAGPKPMSAPAAAITQNCRSRCRSRRRPGGGFWCGRARRSHAVGQRARRAAWSNCAGTDPTRPACT